MVVIGAGVVGAATAHALAEAGARVEVLEAGEIAGGVSAATFAVDISPVKTPRALFDLSIRSGAEHAALAASCGGAAWVHRAGSLEWERSADGRARIRERVRRLRGWGHPVEWVSRAQACEIEPALALSADEADEIAYYPGGAWYEPPVLVRVLLDRARARGTVVHADDPVTEIATDRGRVTAVRTAAGRAVSADAFVNCAGPQAAELAALAGVELPVRRIPGLVAVTTPAPARPRTIVLAPDVNARPHGGGTVLLHSWQLDAELGPGPAWPGRAALARRLLDRARPWLPGLADADVQAAAVGVRPVPADGLPLVGFVPGMDNLYLVVAHSAAHLSPILGRLAAREIGAGVEEQLEPFRPTPARLADDGGGEITDESTRTMLAEMG